MHGNQKEKENTKTKGVNTTMNLICLIKGHKFKRIAFLFGMIEILECERCGKIELKRK